MEDAFKGKSKNTGKDFGSDGLFEEQNKQEALFATLIRTGTIDTCHQVKGIEFFAMGQNGSKSFDKGFLPVFVELKSRRKMKYLRRVLFDACFRNSDAYLTNQKQKSNQ